MGNIDYSSIPMDNIHTGMGMVAGGFFIFNILFGIVLLVVGIILIIRMFRAMKHIEEIKMMMERKEKNTMSLPHVEKKTVVSEKKMSVAPAKKMSVAAKPKK